MKKNNIFQYIVIFLIVYLTLGLFINPNKDNDSASKADFDITTNKEYEQDNIVTVTIKNNTNLDATIKNDCPNEPLTVLKKEKGEWTQVENTKKNQCESTADFSIKAKEEIQISYSGWNHALYGENGTYKISTNIEVPSDPTKNKTLESNEFEIKDKGIIGYLWTTIFYQPIFNSLIYITSAIPGNDLGLAIIILTIIIRTILLIPSQRSMKSQRKIQELQPKLNKIKEKHKNNQEMLAKETMMLWKEHKVNPLSSCLPLFIQLPFLIGIFYVIKSGLDPDNMHLLYGSLKEFPFSSINTNFLGVLELTKVNALILPLIVGGLQFMQMKLAMKRGKKKKNDTNNGKKKNSNEMDMANNMMIYIMPVLIAVFTASTPAGVGLYWSVSTAYGIAQQLVVNKQVRQETTKVKVLKK